MANSIKEILEKLHENRVVESQRESLDEGLFGKSAKEKEKSYEEEIKKIFRDPTLRVAANVKSATETILSDMVDEQSDDESKTKSMMKQIKDFTKVLSNDVKKDPSRSIATLLNLGRKYARESTGVEEIQDIQKNILQLKKVQKIGYDAANYLLGKINEVLLKYMEQTIKSLEKEIGF